MPQPTRPANIEKLIAHEFAVNDTCIYFNHAAVAPWPQRTCHAVMHFAQQNYQHGSLHYPQWMNTEGHLKQALQDLINAPSPDDIALVKNTSEALSMVAYGVSWRPGDNIVINNLEFPSNRIVWESLRTQQVETRIADLSKNETSPESEIFKLCDEKTRLISVSSVQYAHGLKMNLQLIGDYCQTHDILFCVDAIQSVGAMQFDVQQCHVHFAMADGHKWMLAPEGLGFFYCDAALRDQLSLTQYGWHMLVNPGDYNNPNPQIATTARRFECGSPNMLGIHALHASVSLLLEVGMADIETRVLDNTQVMLDEINRLDHLELLSPPDHERLAGIVTFRHRQLTNDELYRKLTQHKIFCAQRGDGIRFSPHFYNSSDQIKSALKLANGL